MPLYARLAVLLSLVGCATDSPAPRLTGATPGLVCLSDDLDQELVLTGEHLGPTLQGGLTEDARLEGLTVTLRAARDLRGHDGSGEARVLRSADARLRVHSATRATVALDRTLGLETARYDVVATQGDAAPSTLPDALAAVSAPQITGLTPAEVCQGSVPISVVVSADSLLRIAGAAPTVTLGDLTAPVADLQDCEELPQADGVEVCASATFEVDPSSLPLGVLGLTAANPAPGNCAVAPPVALTVRTPPLLQAVSPGRVCDTGGTLLLEGSGLSEEMWVEVGGVDLGPITWIDSRTAEVTVPDGSLPRGVLDVAIRSEGGCDAVLEDALEVSVPPVAFSVDPPVVPAGVPTRVQARLAGVFDDVTAVALHSEAGATVEPDWTWDEELPDEVLFTVPDTLAAGVWRVQVDQGEGCPGTPAAELTVLDANALPLESVEPAFAWAFSETPVEVSLTDPLGGSPGLEPGARAWLIDTSGGAAPVRLFAPEARSEVLLSGVVPADLEPGLLDLLVVNPDGTSGLLEDALEVVSQAPPVVTSASPGTLSNQGAPVLTLRGSGFRDPSVALTCRDGGAEIAVAAPVQAWTYSQIAVQPAVGSLNQAVCVARVENADGTSARFSSVSVTNPAQNLFPWQVGPDLTLARRAPSAASGRTTAVRRWLYAIGGDEGDPSTARFTVEIAPVGVYGDLGAWRVLPREMPVTRTLAGIARIGQYLYVIGGSDRSGNAVPSTLRARILDPLDAPWFDGVALQPLAGGLSAGAWSYRVSAVFADDDLSNPGGETLAADLLPVTVPDTGDAWAVTLTWSEVRDAVGYRVYRSPAEGAVPGVEERLLAEVTAPTFTDEGGAVDEAVEPLREGDLGQWAFLDGLVLPRSAPCVTVAPDPFPDPNIVYIYVAGGDTGDGAPRDTIEVLPVAIEGPGVQTAGVWSVTTETLSSARSRCGAMAVDADWHSVVSPGETWVYFAGGATSTGATGAVDAFFVDEGGVLTRDGSVRSMTPARAGFAAASASNFLYAFGGQQDTPSSGGASAELQSSRLPDLRNWNSLATGLSVERHLPGAAQESAVLFVVGGETNTESATTSVDWTNF